MRVRGSGGTSTERHAAVLKQRTRSDYRNEAERSIEMNNRTSVVVVAKVIRLVYTNLENV
jgi:hypothetical protein